MFTSFVLSTVVTLLLSQFKKEHRYFEIKISENKLEMYKSIIMPMNPIPEKVITLIYICIFF